MRCTSKWQVQVGRRLGTWSFRGASLELPRQRAVRPINSPSRAYQCVIPTAAVHPRAILASLVTRLARARHAALTLKMGHAQMTQMVTRSSISLGRAVGV